MDDDTELKKWNFAGRVAKQNQDRWSNAAARWNPQFTSDRTWRIQGRSKKRWHKYLDEYSQRTLNNDEISWMAVAQDEELWTQLKDGYMHTVCKNTALAQEQDCVVEPLI